jgi:tetratricopeptide (TPR) repeat protein
MVNPFRPGRPLLFVNALIISKVSCRTIALEQVKRLLLEELGTYLISETVVKDFKLTKDQITTLTAGIVMTEMVEEKWDGVTYHLKARVKADPEEVTRSIDALRKDREKSSELEETRKKAEEALKEIEKLKKELETARMSAVKEPGGTGESRLKPDSPLASTKPESGASTTPSGRKNQGEAQSEAKISESVEAKRDHETPSTIEPRTIPDQPSNQKLRERYNLTINRLAAIEAFEQAYALDLAERHHESLEQYTRAIKLNPKYALAYNNRGTEYQHVGDYKSAVADYDRAIELDDDDAMVFYNRALAHLILKNYAQTVKDTDRALEINPSYALAYNTRANAYRHLGNYPQAVRDYDRAIELDARDLVAYYNRGMSFYAAGNYPQAIRDYDRAIELDARDGIIYFNRGISYSMLGNYPQAIKDYDRAIELNYRETMIYYNRGIAYSMLGNYAKVIEDCTTVINRDPKAASAYVNRANAYVSLGKNDLAIRDCTKAVELDPQNRMAYFNSGSPEKAMEDLKVSARMGYKPAQNALKENQVQW